MNRYFPSIKFGLHGLIVLILYLSALTEEKKTNMSADQLNYKLRTYSTEFVKIQEADYEWAKGLINEYVNKALRDYINLKSDIPLRNFEYTGSHYEHLKTEAADEVDVMVTMDTKKHLSVEDVQEIPGWVKLKVKNSDTPYAKYTNADGYLLPEKMRSSWLFSIVSKAKNHFEKENEDLPVSFEVRMHGPAVQLDITEKKTGKKLSVDLVLSFQFENDFYVAKPYKISKLKSWLPCNCDLLVRQSFSTTEKALLKDMDKIGNGCRHELLRIVKTIVRNDSALKGKLTSYHLKTAFLRYNEDKTKSWHRDNLSDRFLEYIQEIVDALNNKNLPHFFIDGINLLEGIDDIVVSNMVGRLQRLLSSEQERNKMLKVQSSDLDNLAKKTDCLSIKDEPDVCQKPKRGTLEIMRRFVDDMGNTLSSIIQNSKEVFSRVVIDGILKSCKENHPEFISGFEYSGNLFENLITEGPDDDDAVVLIILKKNENVDVIPETHGGYSRFKIASKYAQFCGEEMFINPEKIVKWFLRLVQEEAVKYREMGVSIFPLGKNNVVKLSISLNSIQASEHPSSMVTTKPTLSVILLPAFMVEKKLFVPLQPINLEPNHANSNDYRWRQSFAMEKKAVLQGMDKVDTGCRHDLFKVVATVLKREPTFSLLLPHMKMLFLVHTSKSSTNEWEKTKLGDRFEEYLSFVADALSSNKLMHLWLSDVNLFSAIGHVTLENMACRIRRILSSEQEKDKVLKF